MKSTHSQFFRRLKPVLLTWSYILLLAENAPAQPSHSATLHFWKSQEFVNKFMGSYGFHSETEPKITPDEKELFDELIPQIKANPALAIQNLNTAITPESSAALEFTLANLYVQNTDYARAVPRYRAAIKKFPGFLRAHTNLGVVLVQLTRYDEALPELIKSLELGGENGNVYGLIGYCHLMHSHFLSAEAAYRKATLFSPENLDWKLGIAQCELQQQNYGECAALFGELIQKMPDKADYWLHQANAFLGLGEPTRAASNYEIVRRMGRANSRVLTQLGDIYINQGVYEMAFDAYMEAGRAGDSKGESAPVLRAAEILVSVGEPDKATLLINQLKSLHKAPFKDNDRLSILKLEARILLLQGDEDQAVKSLEQIVDKDPLDGESILLLADYYGRNGMPEKAELFFQRAEQLDNFEIRAIIAHAQFLVGRGDYADAIPLLEKAQEKRPRDKVRRYLERVQELARLTK